MPAEIVMGALHHAWRTLLDKGVDACLMGGIALSRWGHARFTKDVDLLISIADDTVGELIDPLKQEGFSPRRSPLINQVSQHRFIQLMYTPKGRFDEIPLDLLIADSEFLQGVVARSVAFQAGETELKVVSCEDLILLKLQADRLIDRMDVRYLLTYNRSSLDFPYLLQWIRRFGLEAEWSSWWKDAFPDEPPPLCS